MRRYSKREVKEAQAAREMLGRLAYMPSSTAIAMINKGVLNCPVTPTAIRNADAMFGPSIPALKGKTQKKASLPAGEIIAPRVTQVEQILGVDILFIKKIPFLLGVFSPLGLTMCCHLKNRTAAVVSKGLLSFISLAKSRNFTTVDTRVDGEKSIAAMKNELYDLGVEVNVAGPGQHVPIPERMNQTIQEGVRSYENGLPYLMNKVLIIFCVLFCVMSYNLRPNSQSIDGVSPTEQFTGRKLDMARDVRVGFGEYVQATVPMTHNTLKARTQGCIALGGVGNLTGSVKMLCLATNTIVTRDQFVVLPLPDLVATYITSMAEEEGYSRGSDVDVEFQPQVDNRDNDDILPHMMPIDNRMVQPADRAQVLPGAGVNEEVFGIQARGDQVEPLRINIGDAAVVDVDNVVAAAGGNVADGLDDNINDVDLAADEVDAVREIDKIPAPKQSLPAQSYRRGRGGVDSLYSIGGVHAVMLSSNDEAMSRAEIKKQLQLRSDWYDKDFAFTMSVRAALRERGEEARPVIMAELQQMVDKNVWHGVTVAGLSHSQRKAIIRSSMFLKDKYLASGAFDRFKARLVAGGNQQDKRLYDNLSSPTAATTSVLTIAAIAAAEGRKVVVIDIGGAFLNASMEPTGVVVHMRLDRVMTAMLVQIDPSYSEFVEQDGTMVVALDKALYGCVEASALWYNDLRDRLIS